MANIEYTPYVRQQFSFQQPIQQEEIAIPIIRGQKKPKEEIHLAPLPELIQSTPVQENPTIDGSVSTREGKGRASKQYLMDRLGLSDYQASALVGSFMRESGLNINAENKAEKEGKNSSVKANQYGIGIGQGTHNRHDDFVNWTSQHGNSLQSQLDFAADEIERKYPEFLEALRNSDNSDEASDLTYVMYTGANYKNVTKNNLAKLVTNLENKYRAKHIELYGKDSGNHSAARRKATREAMSYKLGGILKMQKAGVLYAPFNDNSIDRQNITKRPYVPGPYINQYDVLDPPRVKNSPLKPEYIEKTSLTSIPGMYMDNLNTINDRLKDAGFGQIQRAAILATIIQESHGNPEAIGDNGAAKGLFQGHGSRFKAGNDLDSQIQLIIDGLNDYTDVNGGLKNSKYSKQESIDRFNSNDLLDAVTAITYSFIRPANQEQRTKERFEIANKIYNELE